MNLKSTTMFLLGLSFFCLISLIKSQETCEIRFFQNGINNKDYIYFDDNNVAPFTGKAWVDPENQGELEQRAYSSLRAVQAGFCEICTLTIFSTTTFSGKSVEYNFRDGFEFTFPFCAKSFTLNCDSVGPEYPEEEEEMQVPEEEEQEAGEIQFAPLDPSEANSPEIIKLMNEGLAEAIDLCKQGGILPEGDYELVKKNALEKATNIDDVYQFNVRVSDGQGNEFDVVYLISNQ